MNDIQEPEMVSKSSNEIDKVISEIKSSGLSESTQTFCIKCIELACWLPMVLQKKDISLSRLKSMIFGKKKRKQKLN